MLAAVPVAVGYVGGRATTPRRAWALSLAFVAGMNVALLVLGLLAARLGLLLGSLPGPSSIAVGVVVAGAAVWLWRADPASCGLKLPAGVERRLAQSGLGGAAVLGALIGTVMSPCATPALTRRFARFEAWIPGRRAFALVMLGAGLWWITQGLDPNSL